MAQGERVLRYLNENPGAATMTIILQTRVCNFTAVISALRKKGVLLKVEHKKSVSDSPLWYYYLEEDLNNALAKIRARKAGKKPLTTTPDESLRASTARHDTPEVNPKGEILAEGEQVVYRDPNQLSLIDEVRDTT